jgi:copper chaperone
MAGPTLHLSFTMAAYLFRRLFMQVSQIHAFRVDGMTCQGCVKTITEALLACDPAAEVKVKFPGGEVRVNSSVPVDQLMVAIVEQGYGVSLA